MQFALSRLFPVGTGLKAKKSSADGRRRGRGGLGWGKTADAPSVRSHLRPYLLGLTLACRRPQDQLAAARLTGQESKGGTEAHQDSLASKNGSMRRSRFTALVASDPVKPARPQPTDATSRPPR